MKTVSFDFIADLAEDPANGWSIGSFGAIGEFVRDADEPVAIHRDASLIEIVTERGAMRIAPTEPLAALAWDSLSSDGESWGHAMGFCCSYPRTATRVIRSLGADRDAIRPIDRDSRIYDLGVGSGIVAMTLRTYDPGLIEAMEACEGQALLSSPSLMAEVLRAQPHRVLFSPAGRIEVFQAIPPADGKSPIGPHTHLLPKLIVKDRPHSSNIPIPEGFQSALSLHPRSPWRTSLGERHDFRADIDAAFAPMLVQFGLPEDAQIHADIVEAVQGHSSPDFADWPETRRGRTKARIVLRRLAAAGEARSRPWRALHDRLPVDVEEGEDR